MQSDFKTALTGAYLYRLTLSYAPRSVYLADIAALPLFDLLVGQDDEFLFAEAFRPVLESATVAGAYHMVQGSAISTSCLRQRRCRSPYAILRLDHYKWTPAKLFKQWMGFDLYGTVTNQT